MPKSRTILVAVADPLQSKQPAIDRGAQLAKALGARLVLFHAAFDAALSGRPFFDSRSLAKARGAYVLDRTQALEQRAGGLTRGGLRVDVAVVWEEPAHESIIRAAIRDKADLVVAGRHEPRENSAARFRLTDWELMRLCPQPLLVVHPLTTPSTSGAVLAALDPTHNNDKPASLDTSITRSAAAIANALQVECHAAHVMTPAAYPPGVSAAYRKRVEQRMYSKMKQVTAMAEVEVKAVHLVHGWTDRSLAGLASKLPAQILAMGIISRRWVERFVLGDTAEAVVRSVPCDLLLIKPDTFELRLGRTRQEPIVLPNAKKRLMTKTSAAGASRSVRRPLARQSKKRTK